MRVKVPEIRKCCFCIPLRPGIILFSYINIVVSMLALVSLVMAVDMKKISITHDASVEVITSTVLFCILGMSLLLNVMLLVAGCQKDIPMLRLYNYFALATTLAMIVPGLILVSHKQFVDACIAFVAIIMQTYVIVLVRSEVVKLEIKQLNAEQKRTVTDEQIIDVPDTETLI